MKIKVLVSGFGFMGQTHARSLRSLPDTELAGIVDPCDPAERLATVRGNRATESITLEELRGVPHFRSMDEALSAVRADAAVIALPTKLHHGAVIRCLEAKLHVFVEKPLAVSLRECDAMVRAAEENRRLLAVGYVVRFSKEYQFLKETISSGRLGRLKYLNFSRITGIPAWGNWKDPEFIRTSGGPLFDLVSHDIDFARFCLGEPEKTESAAGLGGSQFDMISSILRYRDLSVMVGGGFVTPSSYPFERTFSAYFEKGTLVSPVSGRITEYRQEGVEEHNFLPDNPYLTEMACFIRAVRSGSCAQICTGRDAADTIRCCTQIAQEISYPLPASL